MRGQSDGSLPTPIWNAEKLLYGNLSYSTYTYNAWGQLTGFNDDLGESANYSYYSDGLRASKSIGNDTTKYYYNGDSVIKLIQEGDMRLNRRIVSSSPSEEADVATFIPSDFSPSIDDQD